MLTVAWLFWLLVNAYIFQSIKYPVLAVAHLKLQDCNVGSEMCLLCLMSKYAFPNHVWMERIRYISKAIRSTSLSNRLKRGPPALLLQ